MIIWNKPNKTTGTQYSRCGTFRITSGSGYCACVNHPRQPFPAGQPIGTGFDLDYIQAQCATYLRHHAPLWGWQPPLDL